MWQRVLLQEAGNFHPRNADYYLSNTTAPNLAHEFDLAEQYLRGTLQYTGSADTAPWCRFPARFAFVAKAIYGNYFMPEAFRACNLPLPAVDDSLKAYIIETLEPSDSGGALFHVQILIQGKRFYNGSTLNLNIGFSQKSDTPNNEPAENNALRLLKAFWGNGQTSIQLEDSPNSIHTNRNGQLSYLVNLPPEKIYFLALLAFEIRSADLPYNLLKANCHSYLERIILAVSPVDMAGNKKMLFDYLPAFMSTCNEKQAQLFEPHRYWISTYQQLDEMSKPLNWDEYQILQTFLERGRLPEQPNEQLSTPLRLAIGKAAEKRISKLQKSPRTLALRDEYLSSTQHTPVATLTINPPEDENTVPLFYSPHPSAIGLRALDINGETKLQLELDAFNTMADQLQAASPYGFVIGKLLVEASKHGLAFDHLMLVEESSFGNACCNAMLYQLGARSMRKISLDIVNSPRNISPREWEFKPQLELNFSKGVGTISNNGWSAQIQPNLSMLTYGEYIDLNMDAAIGWTNGKLAVSASKLGRIYGPEARRSKPNETLRAEYKIFQNARVEFSYKHFDTLGTIAGIGYAFAF